MKGQYEIVKNNSLTLIFVSFTKKNREYNFFSFSIKRKLIDRDSILKSEEIWN